MVKIHSFEHPIKVHDRRQSKSALFLMIRPSEHPETGMTKEIELGRIKERMALIQMLDILRSEFSSTATAMPDCPSDLSNRR
jgi:hypothetical protein